MKRYGSGALGAENPMSNSKTELTAMLETLRALALAQASNVSPHIAAKLRQNAALLPSKNDFNSDHEEKYQLELNDTYAYLDAAKLIDEMRILRQRISNLAFIAEQNMWPPSTMRV